MEGIFIANVYDDSQVKAYKEMFSTKTNSFNQMDKSRTSKQKFKESMLKYKKSLISFDKGGMWEMVEAPYYDSAG